MFNRFFIVNTKIGEKMKNKRYISDLAFESLEGAKKDHDYRYHKDKIKDITIEKFEILKESDIYHYDIGTYIEISFDSYINSEILIELLSQQIKNLIKDIDINDPTILIVGLGNKDLSSDAIGPMSVSMINPTHQYELIDRHGEHLYDYICVIPGVSGQSGIESASFTESIVKDFHVDLVIAIDALCAKNYEKLCHVIQITNTGIYPGSGIGNHRKALNQRTLNVPVIAIGVPTVIHTSSLVNDVFSLIENYFHNSIDKIISEDNKKESKLSDYQRKLILGELGQLSNKQREQLLCEILDPLDYRLVLSDKQIDFDIKILSRIISSSLNHIRYD